MIDEDGIVASAFKEISMKIAKRIAKGQIGDVASIPAPSYVHHYLSHLGLIKNDFTQVKYLRKAATISDPVERMKQVITFFVAGHYMNPTLV